MEIKPALAGVISASDTEPCLIPTLAGQEATPAVFAITQPLAIPDSQHLASEIETQNVLLKAWALVLRHYAGMEHVCFELRSSHQSPVPVAEGASVLGTHAQRALRLCDIVISAVSQEAPGALSNGHTPANMDQLYNTAVSFHAKRSDAMSNLEADGSLLPVVPVEVLVDHAAQAGSCTIQLRHNAHLIPDSLAQSISCSFETAIRAVVNKPSSTVGAVNLMSQTDTAKILQWNKELLSPTELCVNDIIAENSLRQPDSPAVCSWDATFSYQQLETTASRLARYLQELGAKPGMFVPFQLPKSASAVIVVLAIMKSGAAFVPIEISYPVRRVEEIVAETGASIMFVGEGSAVGAQGIARVENMVRVCLDVGSWLPNGSEVSTKTGASPSDTCYLLYTSGSTGRPKGVEVRHVALSSAIASWRGRIKMTPKTRTLQFASFSFDVSLLEILATLVYGGCVCVPSEHERVNDLAEAMRAMDVNWACLTNTVARLLRPGDVLSLKTLFSAGEKMTDDVFELWASKVDLHQGYGPTEASILCTMRQMSPGTRDSANIGPPVGCRGWVVSRDDHNSLLPIGSPGELILEGPILARGYWNDPQRTAESFTVEPSWSWLFETPDSLKPRRFYKTGDIVRYNQDGTLTFLGRKDRQVKLNGQRIEPGEIEVRIQQSIFQVCGRESHVAVEVISRQEENTGSWVQQTLHAFVQAVSTQSDKAEPLSDDWSHSIQSQVRNELALIVPKYMIPSAFTVLDQMPTTTSGKLDRAALREIGHGVSTLQASREKDLEGPSCRAQLTKSEEILRQLWVEVLHLNPEGIGTESIFFEFGGNSLLAIQLVAAARRYGLFLSFEQIYQHSSLSGMARVLGPLEVTHGNQQKSLQTLEDFLGITKESVLEQVLAQCNGVELSMVQDIMLATPSQQEAMEAHIKDPRVWVGKMAYRIPADYDLERFCAAWEETVVSVPLLRSRLIKLDSGHGLVAAIDEKVVWRTSSSLDEYFRLLASSSVSMSFGSRLSQFAIVHESEPGSRSFVWTIHHVLYDGWCLGKIFDEVSRRYRAETPRPLVSFSMYINHLMRKDAAASVAFWNGTLSEARQPTFPAYPAIQGFSPLSKATVRHKLRFSMPGRFTPSSITATTLLHTAWALTLTRYEGSANVMFGSFVSGRTEPLPGIEDVAGPTVAIIPFHVRIGRKWSIAELLARVQEYATSTVPFQQRVFRGSAGKEGIDRREECQLRTTLVVAPGDMTDSFPGLTKVSGQYKQGQLSPYPLLLQCKVEDDDGAGVWAMYDDRLLSKEDMKGVLGRFGCMVESLIESRRDMSVERLLARAGATH